MHRALVVEDILRDILAVDVLGTADWFHFGIACKGIWKHVLPPLWGVPLTVHMLSCLFPSDVVVKVSNEGLYISRAMRMNEWMPFERYEQYIKHLVLSDAGHLPPGGGSAADGLFRCLAILTSYPSSSHILLRNLETLRLDMHTKLRQTISLGSSLLRCGRIRSLSIHLPEPDLCRSDECYSPLLKSIARCSDVEHVKLENGFKHIDLVLPGLCRLRRLRRVDFGDPVDMDKVLPALAALFYLETVDVELNWLWRSETIHRLPPGSFPSLKRLNIRMRKQADVATSLVKRIASGSVSHINVLADDWASHQALLHLAAVKWSSIMEVIEGKVEAFAETRFPGLELGGIMAFTNLRYLLLTQSCVILKERDIDLITSSCPALRALSIEDGMGAIEPLNAKEHLARCLWSLSRYLVRCPNIRYVRLPIVLHLTHDVVDHMACDVPSLRRIVVYAIIESDPALTSHCLRTTFPNLWYISSMRVEPRDLGKHLPDNVVYRTMKQQHCQATYEEIVSF